MYDLKFNDEISNEWNGKDTYLDRIIHWYLMVEYDYYLIPVSQE